VEAFDPKEESALQEQLDAQEQRLEGLVSSLRAVDDELLALEPERQKYALLENACASLDELEALGAAELFWGAKGAGTSALETLRGARERSAGFEKEIAAIRERRDEIHQELELAEESNDLLAYELDEAQRRAEEKKLEWVVEREDVEFPIGVSVMPWARGGEDDRRFRRSLLGALAISLLLGLVMPLVDLPLPEAWELDEVPDRLAKLIEQRVELPPPPPVIEETLPDETKPEPAEELVAEEAKPKSSPDPVKTPSPDSKGILAFREKFSNLASDAPVARLGADARISRDGEAAVGRPTRNMVATTAPGSSGGINLAGLSRDVGGGNGELAGVQVARATSSIGTGTGGTGRPLAGGPGLGRTDEEIQIVFDRHKAALYRLYNRELRRDPTLQGQMLLRLRIEPDGSVSLCEVRSSDLDAPQLSAQVASRVRGFDFGAKEVPAVTILYPIDFLPAT